MTLWLGDVASLVKRSLHLSAALMSEALLKFTLLAARHPFSCFLSFILTARVLSFWMEFPSTISNFLPIALLKCENLAELQILTYTLTALFLMHI